MYEPDRLAEAIGDLLRMPPAPDTTPHPSDGLAGAAAGRASRAAGAPGAFDFDEAFADEDRLTQAVTLFALLEMHKRGEATWTQKKLFGPIEVRGGWSERRWSLLERTIEALLFLSPEPVSAAELVEACDAGEAQVDRALDALEGALAEGTPRRRPAPGGRRLHARRRPGRRGRRAHASLSKPRTPPLTQAQAETLAIVAYLQPVSRPEIARIRGVSSRVRGGRRSPSAG